MAGRGLSDPKAPVYGQEPARWTTARWLSESYTAFSFMKTNRRFSLPPLLPSTSLFRLPVNNVLILSLRPPSIPFFPRPLPVPGSGYTTRNDGQRFCRLLRIIATRYDVMLKDGSRRWNWTMIILLQNTDCCIARNITCRKLFKENILHTWGVTHDTCVRILWGNKTISVSEPNYFYRCK